MLACGRRGGRDVVVMNNSLSVRHYIRQHKLPERLDYKVVSLFETRYEDVGDHVLGARRGAASVVG